MMRKAARCVVVLLGLTGLALYIFIHFATSPKAVQEHPTILQKSITSLRPIVTTRSSSLLTSVGRIQNKVGSTSGSNISQSILLKDMRRCSLALGVSQEKLDSNQELLNSLAKNANLLLSSLRTVLPANEMLVEYRNPCWRTNYTILRDNLVARTLGRKGVEAFTHNLSSLVRYEKECLEPECVHCLPYFFLAGFPKCGTTSLASALSKHHQIAPPRKKEPQWWARLSLGDMSDKYLKARTMVYLQYFKAASKKILDNTNMGVITYDGSQTLMALADTTFSKRPDYCVLPAVVSRTLPSSKVVLAMRNPVDALYSCFFNFHNQYDTWPKAMQLNASLYFHDQVKIALRNFKDCLDEGKSVFECRSESNNWADMHASLGTYIYVLHIVKWTQFYPIKNFLFLKTEDFRNHPVDTMKSITDFLSIEPVSNSTAKAWLSVRKNSRKKVSRKYGDMIPETRKLLTDFYAPYNKQLVEFLHDDRFSWS